MATALQTSSEQRTPNAQANLVFASAAGALYLFAGLAVVSYALPHLWHAFVAPAFGARTGLSTVFERALQFAAVVGLVRLGRALAGVDPPKGIRGGIFLVVSAVIAIAFIVRAVGLNVDGSSGTIATGIVALGLAFAAVRFFASARAMQWMLAIEHTGFFHTNAYKRMLGQRVRRLTILGILLLCGSGVYTLVSQGLLPNGDWTLDLPFTDARLTLLADVQNTLPFLLVALALWLAVRAVNVPAFAEFLIATEAEMNKVSWSTRRQLTQDTIVVLVTVALMTLFLLVVDLFWGWLLSRDIVGVLPGKSTNAKAVGRADEVKW